MSVLNKTYRKVDGVFIPGRYLQAFIKNGKCYYVVEIKIFKDGLIDCWKGVDLEGFKEKVRSGWVRTQLPEGARISIRSNIFCNVTDVINGVEEEEFIKEVEDVLRQLNGEPTTLHLCQDIMERYRKTPNEELKEELRQAYEAVPKHNRTFLGDMDSKDWEFKNALGLT